MLVLSRKKDEEISIDGLIQIKVVRVSGNRVQLGISAPANVRIFRSEQLDPSKIINKILASELVVSTPHRVW